MEKDLQTIDNFHNNKSASKEITFNIKSKEETNMDSTNNKTNSQVSYVSLSSGKGVANSPKMGSRRIFTPQFKLQVLESYRSDPDCKGNQRATARKYNIHRRQIQKWLQCESSLRSSVANINHNSVKHQFHNVSMQQQQAKNITIPQPSVNGSSSYNSNQLHCTYLCPDSAKESASYNSINVPSTQETTEMLDANFTAVVAAAAGSIARTTSSSNTTATNAVFSPLRSSAIISANRSPNTAISPLIQHHYGISPFSNVSSTATLPMLIHTSQQPSFQYHSLAYSPSLSHHQTDKQNSASYFSPISVTNINNLSATASVSNSYTGGDAELTDNFDLFQMEGKTYPKILSDTNFLGDDNQFYVNYKSHNAVGIIESFTNNQFSGNSTYSAATYPFGPMDLSLRHCREARSGLGTNLKLSIQNTEIPIKKERGGKTYDVDLTYRKRKVDNVSHSSDDYKNEFLEKHPKLTNQDIVANKSDKHNASEILPSHVTTTSPLSNEDNDIEIEVGMEEKFSPALKPFKLFKPYLLDECENHKNNASSKTKKLNKNQQSNPITETTGENVPNDVTISNDVVTFQNILKKNSNTSADSSNFLVELVSESPRSAYSPATCIPTISPTNFQYNKGSPASSGYESSTSTYSDSSLSSRYDTYTYGIPYSVNLQLKTIYHENVHVLHPLKQVQRWLEKDDSKPLETSSTIALLV